MPTSLQIDPTRTITLRNAFVADMVRRFKAVSQAIVQAIVEADALGLIDSRSDIFGNVDAQVWKFQTDTQKVKSFRTWLQGEIDTNILTTTGPANTPWVAEYIESAHRKGATRAFIDTRRGLNIQPDALTAPKEEFLRTAFSSRISLDKVELLYSRTFTELQGVTAAMDQQLSRILAQGLASGHAPAKIAREMTRTITKLTNTRAKTIARTEIIRAHAEGQLDSFEALGVKELNVIVEWLTAGDERVCQVCADLEGETFTIDEARGRIPEHPNCRCTWIPANVGEKRTTNKIIDTPQSPNKILEDPRKGEVYAHDPGFRKNEFYRKEVGDIVKPGEIKVVQFKSKKAAADILKDIDSSGRQSVVRYRFLSDKDKTIEGKFFRVTSKQEILLPKTDDLGRNLKHWFFDVDEVSESTTKVVSEVKPIIKKPAKGVSTFDKRQNKWLNSLSDEQIEAIAEYTSEEEFMVLSARQRNFLEGKLDLSKLSGVEKEALNSLKIIEGMIDDAPVFDKPIYRGMGFKSETSPDLKRLLDKFDSGKSFSMDGVQSFSISEVNAEGFASEAGNVEVIVTIKKAPKRSALIRDLSVVPEEEEIIIGSDALYRVLKKVVDMENRAFPRIEYLIEEVI